jgi:hypothetical protein
MFSMLAGVWIDKSGPLAVPSEGRTGVLVGNSAAWNSTATDVSGSTCAQYYRQQGLFLEPGPEMRYIGMHCANLASPYICTIH